MMSHCIYLSKPTFITFNCVEGPDHEESEAAGLACPAPLGLRSPPGCNRTFIQDDHLGQIRCEEDEDCPHSLEWWEDNENICSVPGNIYTKCVVGPKYKSCKVFPADHICGYWENLACVFMLETGTFNSE